MAEFKKVFEKFASAEQVTAGTHDDEDGDDEEGDDKKDQARKAAEASASDSGGEGEGGEEFLHDSLPTMNTCLRPILTLA